MNAKPTSERLVEALAQALRSQRRPLPAEEPVGEFPRTPPPPPITIAVSREAGANGHLVARAVGARLGWPVYDQELIVKIAADMGLHARLLETVDEKGVSWLQECLQGFSSAPDAPASAYVHRLLQTLLSLAAKGECVILGRGAAQALPPATTLRVRLIAPLDDRIRVIQKRFQIPPEEAVRKLAQTDRDRSRFVWDYFHKDASDPHTYDLILNSARLGVEACADLIVETLRRWAAATGTRPSQTA